MQQSDMQELKQHDTYTDEEPLYEVSKTTRFIHYIVDAICFYAFAFAIGGGIIAATGDETIFEDINDNVLSLVILGIMFVYYMLFEGIFAQSVGKMVTGSIVVTEDGLPPTTMDIFKRSLCRLIPFDNFSFLIARTGWHDSISKTRVVKKPS